jgi:hypothetical protein
VFTLGLDARAELLPVADDEELGICSGELQADMKTQPAITNPQIRLFLVIR